MSSTQDALNTMLERARAAQDVDLPREISGAGYAGYSRQEILGLSERGEDDSSARLAEVIEAVNLLIRRSSATNAIEVPEDVSAEQDVSFPEAQPRHFPGFEACPKRWEPEVVSKAKPPEFGKPATTFATGTTITLDPCDQDGTDNGRDNITVHLAPDGSTQTIAYATTDVLRFLRYKKPDTSSVAGVLLGGRNLPAADTDYKVLQRKSDDTIDFDWVKAH